MIRAQEEGRKYVYNPASASVFLECLPIPNSSPELEFPKPQFSGCKVHVQLEVSLLSPECDSSS